MAHRDSARLTPAEGRKFAFTVGIAFLVLAAISYWRGHRIPVVVLATLGVLLLLAGLVAPGHLGGVQRAWMGLALAISKVTTPIFMGLVYFLVLTPAGFVARLAHHRPLRHEPVGGSYWQRRPEGEGGQTADLMRQF
ncbi:MAG TPA: SxtJ family membrane protein [Gemmatimonadaceae bacterium]|nr:SxtJ family membrane protein [Gemmatimonadaceae bacterium]